MTPPSLPPQSELSGADAEAGADGAVDTGVQVDHDAAQLRRRRNRRRWAWAMSFVVLTGFVLAGFFLPTPYVLIQPGAVRAAEDRVSVDRGAEAYETDADVLFTTVYVDDATPFGLVRGALDDAIEVRSSEEVYGDRGRDETRRINRQEMDLSKLVATQQALDHLGIENTFTADGVRVLTVSEDSPAESVLESGDVIVAVDGEKVSTPNELREELALSEPGDSVSLTLEREAIAAGESASAPEDSYETLTVESELTDAEGRAVLGVTVEPFEPRIESDVDVEVDSGAVTGPSAGLAWSLAIIDVLTPESLVAGDDVAVTGEILADGSVGVIGGVAQKTATVSRNGVTAFIYPADTPEEEQAEMRRIADDDVELVPVADLDEAVEYLRNR